MVNIKNKDKAAVLAALWNHSHQIGMGVTHHRGHGYQPPMSIEEARCLIATGRDDLAASLSSNDPRHKSKLYFDYLHGRVMKVNLSGDEFNPSLYDRDNGPGAAARAVATVPDIVTA